MYRPSSLVLTNGTIYTMDPARPTAAAVAIRGSRILAVGAAAEVEEALAASGGRRADAEVLDLGGRAVLPGFIDCHVHFLHYALSRERVKLDGVPSLEEALARVSRAAATIPPGRWVTGRGWNKNLWPGGHFPTRQHLDRVAPQHPVVLASKDGHAIWTNTLALQRAGIDAGTPDPPGGSIDRDRNTGEPTGILKETAVDLVQQRVEGPAPEARRQAMKEAMAVARRLGLTGIHNFEGTEAWRAWQELRAEGALGLRVYLGIPREALSSAVHLGLQTGFGDDHLRVGPVKFLPDGALGPQTAAMLQPYAGQPDNYGIVTIPPDELTREVRVAAEAGLASAIHAIGDRANRLALDALAAVRRAKLAPHLRHRIEHAQLVHPDDLPRFARLEVIASVQPIHATADREMADRYWGERCASAYPYAALLGSGARLALGSDAPVESIDPLRGIYAAVTRQPEGEPSAAPWYPEQRLTVAQAVHGFTLGAAYAAGEEDSKGSLTPGKLADLVVLSQDIFRRPPVEIPRTRVDYVIFDGEVYT